MPSIDVPGPLNHGQPHLPVPTRYTLGLDLGKMSDYSALAICEERPERTTGQGLRYTCGYYR